MLFLIWEDMGRQWDQIVHHHISSEPLKPLLLALGLGLGSLVWPEARLVSDSGSLFALTQGSFLGSIRHEDLARLGSRLVSVC